MTTIAADVTDGVAAPAPDRAARVGLGLLLLVCTVVSVGWLALGATVALVRYGPLVGDAVRRSAARGNAWAGALAAAAPASEPLGQALLDFAFSLLNLALAVVLLRAGTRGIGARTWPLRLLAVALVGSAGAFNLQSHAAARAIEAATGLAVNGVHQVVLHGAACAAYILALLVFPTPSWDGLPGARPLRGSLAGIGIITFLLVGLGTALLPHTTSCVLFFGFLVPAVGLVVLPRRVRRGPGLAARTQARLLFGTLVGSVAVATALAVVTALLSLLGATPGLALVDPTAHTHTGGPIALLFWFSRLVSAIIAVVVLVALRHDRLWTAERWFSHGLALLLVTAVGGGGFVVLRTAGTALFDTAGTELFGAATAAAAATVLAALTLSPLYVRAERVVDRLLYGTRPAPYRVLADVTALSHSTASATGAGTPDLARVAEAVALGLGAAVCRITVRRPGLRDRTYAWTDVGVGTGAGDLLEVPIRHGNEQVGALAVDRQAVMGPGAQRDHLLTDIADALGVVLQASRSGIELERQLRAALAHAEEIAVSRRRTVAEMDSERRRIERDLHDGAQHHLVSLRLTLGLVEHKVATGELDEAREWLGKLAAQLTAAEAVLAATVDGVSSLLLAEQGLVAALRAELGAVHPTTTLDDGGIPAGHRFPAEVEAAVWFCCAESVGNARKHAPDAPVTVALAVRDGALHFAVRDEGPGFVAPDDRGPLAGAVVAGGRGLRNMTTRVSAVGGGVVIRSAPGAGTAVEGSVPLPHDAAPVPQPVRDPAPPAPPPPREGRLAGQVRALVRQAAQAYRGAPGRERVDELARRLDEPVRIAVLATVDEGRRMLLEALVGVPALPAVPPARPVRYAYGEERVESGADAVVVTLPAPALHAMTLVDVPVPEAAGPGIEGVRAALGTAGAAADAAVLLLHYGRPADLALLDALHAAGRRGAIGVLARADAAGPAADEAVREYGHDPAVRRVCEVVVSAAPATAAAAARLGDDEYRLLQTWAATHADPAGPAGNGSAPDPLAPDRLAPDPRTSDPRTSDPRTSDPRTSDPRTSDPRTSDPRTSDPRTSDPRTSDPRTSDPRTSDPRTSDPRTSDPRTSDPRTSDAALTAELAPGRVATLLDRLGPLGVRRALRLLRSGEGDTRADLAAALVRHSGLAQLQELIAARVVRRADALRTRSVLAGLDALLQACPPAADAARTLRYELERIRAGAHELREIELLDVLRSGALPLPDPELRTAERLLGADGGDLHARLGLDPGATVEQLRDEAARQPARWRTLAAHPVTSTRLREAAQVLVHTCEQLVAEVDDPAALR